MSGHNEDVPNPDAAIPPEPARRQGQHAGLDPERIVAEALALAHDVGPERFSVRALGARLGVDPMAVYHWFPSRDRLLDAMTDRALAEVDDGALFAAIPWHDALAEGYRRFWRALQVHPVVVPHISTRAPVIPELVRMIDRALELLVAQGLPELEAAEYYQALVNFTFATALSGVARAGLTPDQIEQSRARSAEAFARLDPSVAPHAVALLPHAITRTVEERFQTGLALLIDGIRARVAQLPPAPG